MPDKILVCVECGYKFMFSVGEQRFYGERGLEEPKRCVECRQKHKKEHRRSSGFVGFSLGHDNK